MQEFLKTPKTKTLLYILCAVLVVLLAFGFGIAVGYRRALFASRYGENYYENFYAGPAGGSGGGFVFMGMPGGPPPLDTHGVAGEVIDVSSSTLSVKNAQGDEQSVMVVSTTPIREMDNTIFLEDIKPGDSVTVIGEPNDEGQVEARFIRVFEISSTSLPASE